MPNPIFLANLNKAGVFTDLQLWLALGLLDVGPHVLLMDVVRLQVVQQNLGAQEERDLLLGQRHFERGPVDIIFGLQNSDVFVLHIPRRRSCHTVPLALFQDLAQRLRFGFVVLGPWFALLVGRVDRL